MRHHWNGLIFLGGVALITLPAFSRAAEKPSPLEKSASAEGVRFFETNVRPVLATRCYTCHGAERQLGGLRLDTLPGLLKGGGRGPALVAGNPEKSSLITAVRYHQAGFRMPPSEKLPDRQVADLVQWVKMGAPYPQTVTVGRPELDPVQGRSFWAFHSPAPTALPKVKNQAWVRNPVDAFILAKLEEKGLKPAAPADRRTLIRRATFDLTGLPPTPDEVNAFLADRSPQAFSRVVERLLASPAYGERWGRHWLDVARYADSNGLDENVVYGNAWRYRDYVVNAFNSDKPYQQFLMEQLAGDLLPASNAATRNERLVATGFLALGAKVLAEPDAKKMEMDIIDEQIDTVGRTVMGLTLGCARCHDHKFDPIKTDDYYGLAGIFKSTQVMDTYSIVAKWHENSLATPEEQARYDAHMKQVAQRKDAIQKLVAQATEQLKAAMPGTALPAKPESLFPEATRNQLKAMRDEVAKLEAAAPELPSAMGVVDAKAVDVPVHIRGSHLTLGNVVQRHFPLVLAGANQPPLDPQGSGRLRFAQWLTSPDHPLTGRVMANRVWRWHFGQGIVASTDNFGHLGDPPSHPELLDWMARAFTGEDSASGGPATGQTAKPLSAWSVKDLHRLIMLSNTYQMSSAYDPKAALVDPENRLHWRCDVRRLEAEEIRDAIMAVSGQMDRTVGGTIFALKNRDYVFNHTSKDATQYASRRRALYLPVIRNNIYDVFQLFDFGDGTVPGGSRATTTVAPQALFMMNSELVDQAAAGLAAQAPAGAEPEIGDRIRYLYERAYGRPAQQHEVARAAMLVGRFDSALAATESDAAKRRQRAWTLLCQVLLASSEFTYLR